MDENMVYQELIVQTSFDLFSYLSSRASCDSEAIGGSSKDFIQQVMQSVASDDGWRNVAWVKFILTCVICNGGGLQNNVNLDLEEDVQTRLMRLLMDQVGQKD